MTDHGDGIPAHPLCPHRFSARPEAMVDFLQTLGMRPRFAQHGDSFGVLAAAAGLIAVHALDPDDAAVAGASHGETQLVFLAEDARHTAGRLQEDGLRSMWWDARRGRHAGVTGPHGEGVWFTEDAGHYRQRELLESPLTPRLTVVAVRSSHALQADVSFFAHLGYAPAPGAAAGDWLPLAVPNAPSGMIGLHASDDEQPVSALASPSGESNPAGHTALVDLGFLTTEEIPELAARLTAAGHPAERVEGPGPALTVRDPDGRSLMIYEA
ncbi:hypothetical protein [Nesterenkonia xinjiangensis]|uniref:Glyoxalase-like domain-containing protein n=1 Tax=Nesterenkonia xinjiangensis TaxID=225327 RepID=A0A7Z0GN68_9MICC|nr:hypothetical protein [Nesterenkonia xinjiangensis]NYJ78985.1 hypothetical protein [Nesterenkonia xinjiangensis]